MTLAVVFEHFKDQNADFFTGFITLIISVTFSFISGIYLGAVNEILLLIPGLMVLVTPSNNMRGAIVGILTSRLSSSMHLGTFTTNYTRDTELGDNLRSSLILSILISFVLALFGKIICVITGTEVIGLFEMIIISVISGTIAGVIVTLVGVMVSVICYKKNKDLDIIGAPTVTTVGDFTSLPCLVITATLIVSLEKTYPQIPIILGVIAFGLVIWAIISLIRGTVLMKSILREGLPLLIPLSFMGIVAGVMYTNRMETLISAAAILILMSPFTNGCGSIGSILTSKIGTEMHMGLTDPKLFPQKQIWRHFLQNYIYALILLPIMGTIAHFAAVAMEITTPGLSSMILLALYAGGFVITIMNILGYYTAVITYRIGLDPDNFGIPIITSSIDLLGATAFIISMTLVL